MGTYLGHGLFAETSVRDLRNQRVSQVQAGDSYFHLVHLDVGSVCPVDVRVKSKLIPVVSNRPLSETLPHQMNGTCLSQMFPPGFIQLGGRWTYWLHRLRRMKSFNAMR
jgi:hypothetical protein